MKLKQYWGLDECSDKDLLFDKLNELQDSGKIFYDMTDGWTFLIEDLELSESELEDLIDFFNEIDVYQSDLYDEDEDLDGWEVDDWD